ncbi:MAG: glycosyltransferase [Lachnospira sp.]|nr:glycosyltransferase [Lachnospira sp.]
MSVSSLGIGGNEVFAMSVFRNIDKEKFHIDFVVYDSNRIDFLDEIKHSDSKVFFCKQNSDNKIRQFISEIKQVDNILKNNHYDIVHCNGCSFFNIFRASIPARRNHCKVIAHSHNAGMPKNNIADKIVRHLLKVYMSSSVDVGLACSDIAAQSKYTDKFIQSSKYHLINNAVNIGEYTYSDMNCQLIRKQYNILPNDFVVGNVGRLAAQKNQEYLIRIFFELQKKESVSKLLIIGEGELENKLKSLVKELNIEDKVIFAGKQKASVYYSAMDCLVMPSLFEGLPFVLIEAQINGLPCIVSDTVSRDSNVSKTIHFEPLASSPQKWADSVIQYGKRRIDSGSIKRVVDQFDIHKNITLIEKIYKELVSC